MLGLAGIPGIDRLDQLLTQYENLPAASMATEETFWEGIRDGYRLKPDYINLENGYYCFLPQKILENYINHIREINYQGAYYMRTKSFDDKKIMAAKLATLAGCSTEELVITRNTTESLDLVIGGTQWKTGDEAIMAEQDYQAMQDMFSLVAKRHSIVNKLVSIPNHPQSDEEIVALYANAITPRTKLLMVSHIINITGQILPVKKICDMAHSKGVKVLVDGAHAFGHFTFKISDLDCDYYGTSLHKWLSVPLGAGFLYVKKENIPGLCPLFGPSADLKENDIYRLNHTGTHPCATDLAITNAIEYYMKIGPARKEARLRYLQHYWTDKVRSNLNITLNTPRAEQRSCGIANVAVKSLEPGALGEKLFKEYRIYVAPVDRPGVKGCRITPNIYTTPRELDQLVKALTELAG